MSDQSGASVQTWLPLHDSRKLRRQSDPTLVAVIDLILDTPVVAATEMIIFLKLISSSLCWKTNLCVSVCFNLPLREKLS